MTDTVLETCRMNIEKISLDVYSNLVAMFNNENVMRYAKSGVQTEEQTRIRLNKWIVDYDANGFGVMSLFSKDYNKFVGYSGFLTLQFRGKNYIEFFMRLDTHFWGQGLGTEGSKSIIDYGFNSLNFNEIISTVHIDNTDCIKMAEKLGMMHIDTICSGSDEVRLYHKKRP